MKKSAKKLLALLIACVLIASLAACGNGGTTTSTPPSGDTSTAPSTAPSGDTSTAPSAAPERTLNVAVSNDSGSMHPLTQSLGGFMDVARTYMDVLFDVKEDGSKEWGLATGYETIGELNHTLHLREGVTFSNGSPFTAEDVIFSMETARDHPQWFMNVETVDFEKTNIIDDYTIDLWFTKYDVAQFTALVLMYIFDVETYDEKAMASNPVGTGPYVVTEYVANSHVIVEAREGYWGTAPAIKRIQFKVMNEDSQKVNALTIGEVDSTTIPLKDVEYVESLGNYNITKLLAAAASLTYFNVSEGSPLGTLAARKAVMHAIDRQSIIDIAYSGQSTAPRWPLSEACPDFEERFANMDEVYSIGYDPVRAKALAEQEGLVGKTLRIITNGDQQYITIAEIVQNNLADIGVNAEIINYDQATYWNIVMDVSNFDIAVYLIGSPKRVGIDMLAAYPQFFQLGWNTPDRDVYLELGLKGLGTPDAKERGEILYELAQKFNEIHLWYALAENNTPSAHSKDLVGIEYYADGGLRFNKWSWAS